MENNGKELMSLEIEQMLDLQEQINQRVHPQWREQSFPWYRAIWTECAEMIDQFGWKWWKKQNADWDQLQLELIDIWHFGLSDILQNIEDAKDSRESIAYHLAESYLNRPPLVDSTPEQFRQTIESFTTDILTTKKFCVTRFYQLMALANLPMQVLFVQYVGKNALNHFRQNHGYQSGEYAKQWQNREDNEHLGDILHQISESDITIANLYDAVYALLLERYNKLVIEPKMIS